MQVSAIPAVLLANAHNRQVCPMDLEGELAALEATEPVGLRPRHCPSLKQGAHSSVQEKPE